MFKTLIGATPTNTTFQKHKHCNALKEKTQRDYSYADRGNYCSSVLVTPPTRTQFPIFEGEKYAGLWIRGIFQERRQRDQLCRQYPSTTPRWLGDLPAPSIALFSPLANLPDALTPSATFRSRQLQSTAGGNPKRLQLR